MYGSYEPSSHSYYTWRAQWALKRELTVLIFLEKCPIAHRHGLYKRFQVKSTKKSLKSDEIDEKSDDFDQNIDSYLKHGVRRVVLGDFLEISTKTRTPPRET